MMMMSTTLCSNRYPGRRQRLLCSLCFVAVTIFSNAPVVDAGRILQAESSSSTSSSTQEDGTTAAAADDDNTCDASSGTCSSSSSSSGQQQTVMDTTTATTATTTSETSLTWSSSLPEPDSEGKVPISYGEAQQIVMGGGGSQETQTAVRLHAVHQYMEDVVFKDPEYSGVKNKCQNRHESCTFWAALGECEKNPPYMTLQCAPACYTCDKLIFEKRCPWNESATPHAWGAGDLNAMFNRITTEPYYQQFQPNVLVNGDPGPWVVTMDKFLTSEECQALIELGAQEGYKVSEDVGERNFDGTYSGYANAGRTSTNAWCQNACYENATTQRVLEKIENLTGIPDINSEYLQLLRYEPGQFYQQHHDYIAHHISRAQGPRILTVFLYLNDVEAGGGTNFPKFNLTVMPSEGKALLWPSVRDSDPLLKDYRTEHQALPVEAGIKYGANAWVHLRDFKTPYKSNCI